MSIGKQQIIEKIANSSKGVWILGIANLDLNPFEDCYEQNSIVDILFKKFTEQNNYEISIITESLPQLAKISQSSYFNDTESGSRNLSLLEIKKSNFEKIREVFKEKKVSNINPTEQVCRNELDLVFNKNLIQNIIAELATISRRKEKEIVAGICDIYSKRLTGTIEDKFRKSNEYNDLVNERRYVELGKIEASFETKLESSLFEDLSVCNSIEALVEKIIGLKEFTIDMETGSGNVTLRAKIEQKDKIAMLVNCVLTILYQIEPNSYKQIRDNAAYKATLIREQALEELSTNPKYKQRLWVKNFCDDIYQQVLKIDDEYFLVKENGQVVNSLDLSMIEYFTRCLKSNNVAEITSKGNKAEVVPCYIEVPTGDKSERCNRYNIGQRARDAFYYEENESMKFVKNVAWALVFDRKGNVLLHKRGMNAKDNQDMWDKSVGGHIGIDDPDSIYGARREIIEELYTIEGEEQGHAQTKTSSLESQKDPERIIFLGQWDEKRYPKFKEFLSNSGSLKLDDNEYYCFKYECNISKRVVHSKRKLPSGKILYANCFVDLFFVIASKNFNLSELKNSEYLCVPPVKVQEFRRAGRITREDGSVERFDVTPDLSDLLSDSVWDNQVTIFAKSVGDAFGE